MRRIAVGSVIFAVVSLTSAATAGTVPLCRFNVESGRVRIHLPVQAELSGLGAA